MIFLCAYMKVKAEFKQKIQNPMDYDSKDNGLDPK